MRIQPLLIGTSYIFLFQSTNTLSLLSRSFTSFPKKKSTANMNMSTQTNTSEAASSNAYESGCNSVAFVTTPDETIAKKLAHQIVINKLAACVNIIPKITSIYVWDDKINEDSEVLLMIKTRTSRINDLTKFVRENHPYSVAEVITLPIENGNPPYLDWILKSVPDAKK